MSDSGPGTDVSCCGVSLDLLELLLPLLAPIGTVNLQTVVETGTTTVVVLAIEAGQLLTELGHWYRVEVE